MSNRKIEVQGITIKIYSKDENDYISLTDIVNSVPDAPRDTIRNWLKNSSTVTFLSTWENVHNENFQLDKAEKIAFNLGKNTYNLSAKIWIEQTKAIGLQSKTGRYGGTFAHSDIALNFCYWLSPEFQVYFVKEFQRLKIEEAKALGKQWDVNRYLSKINYHIHTDSIKAYLVTPKRLPKKSQSVVYASEADVLNMAVFGITAKNWHLQNANKTGNIRDHATAIELQVLANMETLNASLIELGVSQQQRLNYLSATAEKHFDIIKNSSTKLPK